MSNFRKCAGVEFLGGSGIAAIVYIAHMDTCAIPSRAPMRPCLVMLVASRWLTDSKVFNPLAIRASASTVKMIGEYSAPNLNCGTTKRHGTDSTSHDLPLMACIARYSSVDDVRNVVGIVRGSGVSTSMMSTNTTS